MAARSRVRWRSIGVVSLVVLALTGAVLIGPRIIDGHAALEGTRHYAGRGDAARQADSARQAARWAARALERSAPLPYGKEATRLAIEAARNLEPTDPAGALQASTAVRSAIDGLPGWRRLGLGDLALEA